MARIQGSNNDKIHTISKWLGVNESADGDIGLRPGEASTMTNFKITDELSLQKRPGTKRVATLLSSYTVTVDAVTTTVYTDVGPTNSRTFDCYPSYKITPGGLLEVSGTKVVVDYNNFSSNTGKYWSSPSGMMYKLGTAVLTPPPGTAVTGGYITLAEYAMNVTGAMATVMGASNGYYYDNVQIINGVVSTVGNALPVGIPSTYEQGAAIIGKYAVFNGNIYKLTDYSYQSVPGAGVGVSYNGNRIVPSSNATWEWKFYAVTVAPNNPENSVVRGIWSGRIGSTEYNVAACNGHLWSLSESDGVWTRTDIGGLSTTMPVHFFGFDDKLYMLNGSQYKYWDGETFADVIGYVPLVAVAVPPSGVTNGGLQRVNMLTAQRRIWVSPDGTATTFTLPEKGLASVNQAIKLADNSNVTIATSDLAAGKVTFAAAPAAGTNTIEITYTASASLRADILKMKLSELYNGITDNRVFIYGDGTNKAFYSDLDYNGKARADYFPDLNVIHFGDSSTPLTSMVRHYDRLLAFKTDSAYSVAYDTITLVTGAVTAGFYVTTVNKGLGSAGYGQAVVVGNQPRTLDGRAIYEWVATTSSGNITADQRNAQRISQNVQRTLREINLEKALTFHDKVNHEYYVVENGVAIVQNTENGAWYIYRDFPAVCMIVYKDELYYGLANGDLRHVSRAYMNDCGENITCYWESGSMDFGARYAKKYADSIWVVLKPEESANVFLTVQTDKQSDYQDEKIIENYTDEVAAGFFSFLNLDFAHFTFNINDKPHTQRRKIKAKNFAWYKLIFSTVSKDTTATILSTSIKVRMTGTVR